MSAAGPSKLVIQQRIRNRVIECLEMLSEYEADPPAFDLNEVLNQWEDWVVPTRGLEEAFPTPPYSMAERQSLGAVRVEWEVLCSATPQIIRDEAEVMALPEWSKLMDATNAALIILRRRGEMSEHQEEQRDAT